MFFVANISVSSAVKIGVDMSPPPMENRVFVAVPEDFGRGKSTLLWALKNLVENGAVVYLVHVHCPEREPIIPWVGEEVRDTTVKQELIEDHRQKLRAEAEKKLDEYVALCHTKKVSCKKLIIDKDDVTKGLQELIDRHGITKLVMGGAADERYIEKMESLESKTAIRLMQIAASTCKIWFTCNGQLIHTSFRPSSLVELHAGGYRRERPPQLTETRSQISDLKQRIHRYREDLREAEESLWDVQMAEVMEGRYLRNLHDANENKSPLTNMASQNLMEVRNAAEESFCYVEMPREMEKWYQHHGLHNVNVQNFTLEQKITEIEHLIKYLNSEIGTNKYFLEERKETAVTEDRSSLHEKNDEITAMALPAETLNTQFSSSELMQAMERSNNTLMGEGRSGKVYKGFLRNTDVAIKWLHGETVQGESDFNQKVAVLGRVRHPNLVTLIGVCREALCLVYEFLPNGSLEDRLACNNKMPPLTWQVRTKIIYEMCSALIFLHSNEPQPVVHGDLKPSNVLLDANFVSKVGDFGICMDGDPTTQSDVHSFGVIILQLLTRLPPEDVAKVVEDAMEKEELHTVLDPTAGNWPIALAKQLADVGLWCVKMSREERPDLVGDVWKELESHKNNAGILTSGQDDDGPPNYFICPITRDVMENPHFAADGHTYELGAILQWIHGDHGKSSDRSVRSPMTNLKLEHFELTPNFALSSEIREWKEKQQQKQVRSVVCDPHPVPVQNSDVHTIIITPEEEEAQSQPPIGLVPQVSSSPPTTVIPSLTDDAGSSSLTQSPNTALPPASSSPPTTLIPSTADARSGRSTAPAPLNTSAAARSHRLNPLPANPSASAPPPPRPVSPSSTDFLPPPTGIRRRRVNGRLPSSSTEPDVPAEPGETSRIRGKFKHE